MAFFTSGSSSAASEASKQTEQIKKEAAEQIASADVSELVRNMSRACFDLCFESIGPEVSMNQRECTRNCVKKFMLAWNETSSVYVNKLS